MAKLIIDIKENTKKNIERIAARNKTTIKATVLNALQLKDE